MEPESKQKIAAELEVVEKQLKDLDALYKKVLDACDKARRLREFLQAELQVTPR